LQTLHKRKSDCLIIWRDEEISSSNILALIESYKHFLIDQGIIAGSVVGLRSDFSPAAIALLIILIEIKAIIVLLPSDDKFINSNITLNNLTEIAVIEHLVELSPEQKLSYVRLKPKSYPNHYKSLRQADASGLVLFSSGSTGKPKVIVHNFELLLQKFKDYRKQLRTVAFLFFDHIGGINTLCATISANGCLIIPEERSPDRVFSTIENHCGELLPTSPSFLRLSLASEVHRRYELKYLKRITYGTESMPQSLLNRLNEVFPQVQFSQTYGLSEIGIMRAKSLESSSLWVKLGGEGTQTRVINGELQIKAPSAMIGYLNAPDPFLKDGWLNTTDRVEVNGEYIKFLGRSSDIINVGGEKVYPQEIESLLLTFPNVTDVVVYGKKNPVVGEIVCAKIQMTTPNDKRLQIKQMQQFCRQHLSPYKIPRIIEIIDTDLSYNARGKKERSSLKDSIK
jgi:acyl-coenzyme A synthetase/AMP-(fatty) acid ligase